jgi:hypothetical protein
MSSSYATTVDRGDSFRSYLSADSGPGGGGSKLEAPHQLTHQASFAISESMGTPLSMPLGGQPTSSGSGAPGPSNAGASTSEYFPNDRKAPLEEAIRGKLGLHIEEDLYSEDESDIDNDDRFVNFALLSHLAVRLRDNVPRGTHVKGNIPYPRAFTGKDIVVRPFSSWYVRVGILKRLAVDNPIPNSARAADHAWHLDKRPAHGAPDRTIAPEPALLL